jgi:hypothetical protein
MHEGFVLWLFANSKTAGDDSCRGGIVHVQRSWLLQLPGVAAMIDL